MSAPAEDEAAAARADRADRLTSTDGAQEETARAAAAREPAREPALALPAVGHADGKPPGTQGQGVAAACAQQIGGLEEYTGELEAPGAQEELQLEPEPEPELQPKQTAKWWVDLEIEELRQDLKLPQPAAAAPDGWDDIDDSWMRPPQAVPDAKGV